jgi:hypothetical protein
MLLARKSFTSLELAAMNHDRASPQVFLPVNAKLPNPGTIECNRNERVERGLGCNLIFARRWGDNALGGCTAPEWIRRGKQRQRNPGQGYKQTD